MGAAGGVGAGLGIMGGILGGVGDIMSATKYERPRFPDATGQERRYRKRGRRAFDAAQQNAEQGSGLYNMLSLAMLDQLGFDVSTVSRQGDIEGATLAYQERVGLNDQQKDLQAKIKAAKGPEKKALRQQLKELKKKLKGMPSAADLANRLSEAQSNPYTVTGVSKRAPSVEDQLNQQAQDALAQRIVANLSGDEGFDPYLERVLEDERETMQETMRRNLGEDWATSTPGIEAQTDFSRRRAEALATQQRNDLRELRSLQLGGAETLLDLTGGRQRLMSLVPGEMRGYADTLADIGRSSVGMQSPFQFDRQGGWMESQTPSSGQYMGQQMSESGDHWASIGSSIGSMGGGR